MSPIILVHLRWALFGFSSTSNPISFLMFSAYLAVLSILAISFLAVFYAFKSISLARLLFRRAGGRFFFRHKRSIDRLNRAIELAKSRLPQKSIRSLLFSGMHTAEMRKMVALINRKHSDIAWYSPTAFWPSFNDIKAPRLMCVPDMVLYEFPIPFANFGEPIARARNEILTAIEGGANLVTYSDHIKWGTLVKMIDVDPSKIWVVRHAPSTLSRYTEIAGFSDNAAASLSLNRAIALGALGKATGPSYMPPLKSFEFKFLFYASQFRPSKNVITLLRAYEYLLRKRYVKHKLILTGFGDYPSVRRFIAENNLNNDVLCLSGLTEAELAALYKCADLAVNPSLSEGGMPFTITEALSVGTPVVMGDIEVTREIVVDPALRESTLFDPYDWKAMADKIEWALQNRDALYAQQRQFFDVLAKRTWKDVVKEHIRILDVIAEQKGMTPSL
ncbi:MULTISPECIES: glycosyltransferase [unclassified Mesorhizobium]|uniref:glycosyltransferase n=2 Tax=unclassified Mesorhizobium TaxID=325217 RepID=UPI0015E3C997|nr:MULTISPECIES: glycosyltransferase [unclassified Mesorhizobium]